MCTATTTSSSADMSTTTAAASVRRSAASRRGSGIGRGRQGRRKNNDRNADIEFLHDFPSTPLRPVIIEIPARSVDRATLANAFGTEKFPISPGAVRF
jgi:hypothetical protein